MSYKPKYAAAKPAKKVKGKGNPFLVFLGAVISAAFLAVTVMLLVKMVPTIARPKLTAPAKTGNAAAMEQLDVLVADAMRYIDLSISGSAVVPGPEEEEKEETVPVVHKRYWIEEGTQVCPEPNQDLFGEAADPSELQWLLDEAAWMLEGQELYFSTETEIYSDSVVNYFLDESMFAVTWQEVHDGSVYTFSEVKVRDPSQFRRHLADGVYGGDIQYYTTEMAASVNAVVASAGDFYRFRNFGIVVYEGQVRKVEGTYAETCYIDRNGDMHFTYGGEILTTADAQAYVDENDIQFSLAFGPVLVDNYEVIDHTWYGVGEITEGYARAALCQMGDLHYIVVTANTTGPYQQIPTVKTFAKHIAATGCRMAYCLDGGQTATIVMNDQLINRPVYGEQRKISDIIYFATAVPEGG